MSPLMRVLTSAVGRKLLMAVTGLLLIGFLIVHLAGNLLVFSSAHAFNVYSDKLISNPLIYPAELGLLLLFLAHLVSAILVTITNWVARPVPYVMKKRAGHTSHKSLASTIMLYTGIVVLGFVPIHLYTFKFGPDYASAENPHVRDLYRLVIEVFHDPSHVAWYVLAMIIMGFHLWHGFGSAFESLGFAYCKPLRMFGQTLAIVLAGGFVMIPLVIFLMGGKL